MRRINELDQAIRDAVAEALADAIPDETARTLATDRVSAGIAPLAGSGAQKRRMVSALRAAFKDGFLSGRSAGRFARWHSLIWSQSATARSLREPTRGEAEAQSRYAAFNFD